MPWEKRFDIGETLEKAGQTFWSQGYEATSMRDLLEAMGIQKGSFYDTYGSKHEVFLRSLQQYSDARLEDFKRSTRGLGAVEALRALFEAISQDCISPTGHRGCMIVNCALEMAHGDPQARAIVRKAVRRHEELFRGLIQEGQKVGEIDSELDSAAIAQAMMSFVMGMRVYSRSGCDLDAIQVLADQAIGLVIEKTSAS